VIALWTAGSIIKNSRDSLAKRQTKSVSTDLSRRIDDGWLRIDLEGMKDSGEVSGELHGGAMARDGRRV